MKVRITIAGDNFDRTVDVTNLGFGPGSGNRNNSKPADAGSPVLGSSNIHPAVFELYGVALELDE